MSGKENISKELESLNSSLIINQITPYQVPQGYFEGLSGQVLRRIRAMETSDPVEELTILSPYLSSLTKSNPYTVPTGYFEELDPTFATIDDKNEIEVISPLLGKLKKDIPYTVPAGYFESLDTRKEKKTAKLINLRWTRIAAAAVVTGLIVMAAFLFRNDKEPGTRVLAKITRDVKKMNEVQKENLLDFIDAGLSGDETVQVSDDTKSTIKTLIQGVPEEELKDFEEQTEAVQDVLMTN